ncbi:MAG: hypothetical protein HOM14_11075 [Gammaproteobacteria bacterium]|nr:hypothetical protein [Gammaproteobacteria bacterium]MBT3723655.1 hypothetical protein [Gammaproteobacteria bacterium]MBT4077263.1 hypothetical protein [Gammaproteobacteria bacterium]MBT4194116.1 hypothetical protein [Gammaproteobacteria bacterium]MBT4450658.1 hypothetical protein [Gammaproteobacteria bacterium]
MNKLFPRLALVSLALLFTLFLVLGNIFIYQKQRTSYHDAFKETQQTDLKLLSQLAREALITQNYALIEWFFNTWGLDYQKVVRLTLENQNGFALSKYQRRKAAEGETITNSNTLVLHDGSYTITITSDSIEIDNLLEELKLQLLLVNAGATLLVILNIWFLFQRFAIRHLHQEMRLRKIAEDKLKLLERG